MVPSARLRAYRHGAGIEALARSFLPQFPELRRMTFELDLMRSSSGILGLTDSDRRIPRIRLRAGRPSNPSLTYAIPHEFTHLLQEPLRVVPQGERSCDLYAMARAGRRFLVSPGYLRVPSQADRDWVAWAAMATRLARRALGRRSEGERRYIVWWERAFRTAVLRGKPRTASTPSRPLKASGPRRGSRAV